MNETVPAAPAEVPISAGPQGREGLARALRDAEGRSLQYLGLIKRMGAALRRAVEENTLPTAMRAEATALVSQAEAAGCGDASGLRTTDQIRISQLADLARRQTRYIEQLQDSRVIPLHMRGEAKHLRSESARLVHQ
jgi:hypothetical protein